ncbi:MAG: hypothetical protein UR23_C0016G0008 [Candidatus Roizmanbacteria bacterium GW2011_GWA2_32_13]|uniref:Uncharacterized protein n=1 Tax=Candidatus Roizmanbacteria bacterium GW2011_GWA2_32_13 TaxID=1618475 RepID=A0A0F9YYV3_9BACT|nr:MAG: hypothetical protein UR23_C0016G0008 [Candidatus Roizmanbacteria bacterium GW2011_GWA2_32_13]
MSQFTISVIDIEGKQAINFANNSKNFVEVVFTIDGKEVKEGKTPDETTKGYGYPPKLEKPVKKKKDGTSLIFNPRGGEVVAYIFAGEGKYKNEDMDKPTFLRHKLVDKVSFKRTSDQPTEIIKIKY